MRFLFIILLFTSYYTFAQQPFFYKYDDENNFQSNEVYQVEQDSFGFIWIGCDAGVFRFDGVRFKQYVHQQQNGRSISNLLIDDKQRVWCQNFSGQIFYIFQDSIHLFQDFSKEISSFPIFTIVENKLLVSIDTTFRQYDISTKKMEKEQKNFKKNSFWIDAIASLKIDETYFHSKENIILKNKKNNQLIFEKNAYQIHRVQKIRNKILTLVQKNKDKTWHFFELDKTDKKLLKSFDSNTFGGSVYMLSAYQNGYLIGTSQGVFVLNNKFEMAHHFLSDEKITDALLDKEGNLWLTSLQNGIYVLPSVDLKIYKTDKFPEANITALFVQKDKLLIGTHSGDVYNWNVQKTDFSTLKFQQETPFATVKKFVENQTDLVIARGSTTISINKKNGKQTVLPFGNARDMLIADDSIFAVNSIGFSIFSLNARTVKERRDVLKESGRAIAKDPKTPTFFVATKNGFYRYQKGKIAPILFNDKMIFPTCFGWHNDTLWLGTLSDGFLAYHNGKFLYQFQQKVGENLNMIRALKVYQNWLLLSTDLGLMKMNLATKRIYIYNQTEGLLQKEVGSIEVLNNEIFLGTTKGLIRFPFDLKAENTTKPNILLHAVVVNDSISLPLEIKRLQHFENNLRFEFQTALFRSRKGFVYEYRLKGLDETWKTTEGTSPFAQYRSLPAGDFVFEVRAVNEDGIKSEIATHSFTIELPIWQRWWFVLLGFLVVSFAIYWFFNRRVRNIHQQAKLENDFKTSQLIALKAQMNPHFLYNALNSIQFLIFKKDVKKASLYLTKFSHLMRQILDASGHSSIPLSAEVQILNLYLELEKLRFGDNFTYSVHLPDGNFETIQVPSMIIQPFVENAVKHGLLHKTQGLKTLDVHFDIQDLLICTIIDNGIGRNESAQIKARQGNKTTSFATSATQKRLEILNQMYPQKIGLEIIDLYDNETAAGTKVIIRIPFVVPDTTV